jgi:hypothetical protein
MTTAVEETLVLVKPDGVARNLTGEILRRIEAKSTRASPSTSPSSSSWSPGPSSRCASRGTA